MSGETGLNMQFTGVTGPFMSAGYQEMVITYKGFLSNYPGVLESPYVSLTGSTYALNDESPEYLTASTYTGMVGCLTFSATGVVNAFNWKVKEDEGTNFYNKTIHLNFLPGVTGITYTNAGTTTVSFSRTQAATVSTASQQAFSKDYSGQSGQDLKRSAPRT